MILLQLWRGCMILFAPSVEVVLHHFPLALLGDCSWKVVSIPSSNLRGRSVRWRVSLICFTRGQITCKNYINILPKYTFQWSPVIDWFLELVLHHDQTSLPTGNSFWTLAYRICIYMKFFFWIWGSIWIYSLESSWIGVLVFIYWECMNTNTLKKEKCYISSISLYYNFNSLRTFL